MSTASILESSRLALGHGTEEEWPFEIVDGQRLELPPMSAYASRVAFRIASRLDQFGRENNLGEAVVEMLFHLALPEDRNRRPDSAFVSYQRWAKGRPMPEKDNAWDVVPEIMAEVLSPNDHAEELLEKVEEYFRAGAQLVWVVSPGQRRVFVFESPTRIRVLVQADVLDGGNVLPGFRLPLVEVFPGEKPSN